MQQLPGKKTVENIFMQFFSPTKSDPFSILWHKQILQKVLTAQQKNTLSSKA